MVLTAEYSTKSKKEIAWKLHRQFAHAPTERIIKLLKSAKEPWNEDKDLFDALESVFKECETCNKYQTALPRPVVGLPMASKFKETVAMDIKTYDGKYILHLIDHATRLSTARRVPNKQPETIVKAILHSWISVYGPSEKFLTDNGGEFVNEDLIALAESFGIIIKTTGAEAPWSNGLVERHNRVLGEMLNKIIDGCHCTLDVALAWAVNAKNSLANVHGFSPYQLVLGSNPVLPSVLHDKVPALSSAIDAEKYLLDHLQALHIARQSFIQAESSSKIRQALNSNVRSYSDAVYCHGDLVYYKRLDSPKWKGPASVLGKEGQQVLLKHGGRYIRVHPCRLTHVAQRPADEQKHANNDDSLSQTIPDKTANETPDKAPKAIMCFDSDEDGLQNEEANDLIDFIGEPVSCETQNVAPSSEIPSVLPSKDTELAPVAIQAKSNSNSLNAKNDIPSTSRTEIEPSIIKQTSSIDKDTSTSENEGSCSKLTKTTTIPRLSVADVIEITTPNNDAMKVKLISRAGKVGKTGTNKYSQSWNVLTPSGTITEVNLKRDVSSWSYICRDINVASDQELNSNEIYQAEILDEINTAKAAELRSWLEREVYDEVQDKGQSCISVRWVITPKSIDGKLTTKARLVAKGFQEVQDFRTDSPTCSRESLRLMTAIIASNKWPIQSIDIKTAFLQGHKLKRSVFLRPPPEANTTNL